MPPKPRRDRVPRRRPVHQLAIRQTDHLDMLHAENLRRLVQLLCARLDRPARRRLADRHVTHPDAITLLHERRDLAWRLLLQLDA